jgi:hypothetical protein
VCRYDGIVVAIITRVYLTVRFHEEEGVFAFTPGPGNQADPKFGRPGWRWLPSEVRHFRSVI